MLCLLDGGRHVWGLINLPAGNQRGDGDEGVFEGRHFEGGVLNAGNIEIEKYFVM
jgi:hypothetical protein